MEMAIETARLYHPYLFILQQSIVFLTFITTVSIYLLTFAAP